MIRKEAGESFYEYRNFNSQMEIEYLNKNIKEISKCLLVKVDDLPLYLQEMVLKEKKRRIEKEVISIY